MSSSRSQKNYFYFLTIEFKKPQGKKILELLDELLALSTKIGQKSKK